MSDPGPTPGPTPAPAPGPAPSPAPAPGRDELLERLGALARVVARVDPADAPAAEARLSREAPPDGPEVSRIEALARAGLEAGWLCPRAAGGRVRFGRLARDLEGLAVDAVWMKDAEGLGHTHTRGELNLCLPLEGAPRFDGRPPGWVVFPPGSHHVPTVTGGAMLFLYFTPGGEVVWDRS